MVESIKKKSVVSKYFNLKEIGGEVLNEIEEYSRKFRTSAKFRV